MTLVDQRAGQRDARGGAEPGPTQGAERHRPAEHETGERHQRREPGQARLVLHDRGHDQPRHTEGEQDRRRVTEAGLVGLVSSGVGMLAGVGLATGIRGLLDAVGIEVPTTTPVVAPRTSCSTGSIFKRDPHAT